MTLLVEGLLFSSFGVLLMFIFEFGFSTYDIRQIRKLHGGMELHIAGIRATIVNHVVFGPITYDLTIRYCCTQHQSLTRWERTFTVVKFLLIENALYYCAHYLMHTRHLYRIHRFHHKFNVVVLPSSASAVSAAEFLFAYMSPFLVAAWGASCDKHCAIVAALIIIVFNLIIHTPALEEKFARYPWLFVSPGDHLTHHRQLKCHYSAPIFHFDRMILSLREFVNTVHNVIWDYFH
mmetsp:Transcript_27236/g.56755  ORF Transcript_27236/g.56755 Transcript_27236/m.56755 type:complete len:235 (-) Transcript_27236:150-854(-)